MSVVFSRPAYFILSLLGLISVVAQGQSMVAIHHQVTLGDAKVVLGEWQKMDSNVSVRIDKLRWYVSLPPTKGGENPGKSVGKTRRSSTRSDGDDLGTKVWLLDLADSSSLNQIYVCPKQAIARNFAISLLFGVDSAIQVGGVGKGALDPQRGMYWTWQTGYVQWKMEGVIRVDEESHRSDGSAVAEYPMELHLGGFDAATKAQAMLSDCLVHPTTNSVIAQWELSPFIARVLDQKKFGVMSPSPIARDYCRIIAGSVTFHQ